MVIAVVLWMMVVFIIGHVKVLVGRVALIFSVVITIALNTWKTCQLKDYSDPIKNEKELALDKGTFCSADSMLYTVLIQCTYVNLEFFG